MKVLVACECSGRIREAFRKLGHDAWSCDLQPSKIPSEYHIQDYVEYYLTKEYGWDLLIAHPPCTDLSASGAPSHKEKQEDGRQQASIDFFMLCVRAPINMIAVENPVSIIASYWQQPTQIIQPWMFGDSETKTTCLWLKNLPPLTPTQIVSKGEFHTFPNGKRMAESHYTTFGDGKTRSRTYHGIARAMAAQWGNPDRLITTNKFYFSKHK